MLLAAQQASADPCGMVPPIYTGPGQPITRIGDQMTYVFYNDGIETFVIRPGFEGKVDEFGMLIPFPSVPAIRKVPDHIFSHIEAAVDPLHSMPCGGCGGGDVVTLDDAIRQSSDQVASARGEENQR